MSERYTRLFSLPSDLHAGGAPVAVNAGTLLRDNVKGNLLAQLKLWNISSEKIDAVKVELSLKGSTGSVLGDKVEYRYTGLGAGPSVHFGQKVPVNLPDVPAQSYDVCVKEVVFDGGRVWTASEEAVWLPVLTPKPLGALGDAELIKEFDKVCGAGGKYIPEKLDGMWRCTCGALCSAEDKFCSTCSRERDVLLAVNMEELARARDERLAAAAVRDRARKKKTLIIGSAALAVLIIAAVIITVVVTKPGRVMDKAREYAASGDYASAVAVLDELDRPDKTASLRNMYAQTMENEISAAIELEDYAGAVALIEEYTVLDTYEENMGRVQAACHHSFEDTERLENTCTEDGFLVQTCADCRYVVRTEFIAPGHNHISELTVEQSCTTDGTMVYTCSACGDRYIETLPMLPHNFESEVTLEPTCTEEGVLVSTCLDCGKEVSEAIELLPHTNETVVTKYATCTAVGEQQSTCTVCGFVSAKEKIPVLPHSNTASVAKAATCTEKGVREYRCTVCSALDRTEDIEMLPHSNETVVTKAATCTEGGTQQVECTACGHVSSTSDIAPLGHDHVKSTIIKVSCIADGTDKYTCSRCGDTYNETVPATGHGWVEATCTEPKKCENCGLREGTALGHYWDRKYSWYDITCTRCKEKYDESSAIVIINCNFPQEFYSYDYNDELQGVAYFEYLSVTTEVSGVSGGKVELKAKVVLHGFTDMDYFNERFDAYLYDASGKLVDDTWFRVSESDPADFSETLIFSGLKDKNVYNLRFILDE